MWGEGAISLERNNFIARLKKIQKKDITSPHPRDHGD